MRFQLAMALAVTLMLHAGVAANAATDVDTAAKDTGHATAKASEKTAHATGHAVKQTAHGIRKGAHGVGHGVKKGATKTVDALK